MTRRSDDDSGHPTIKAPPGETDDFDDGQMGLLILMVSKGTLSPPQNVAENLQGMNFSNCRVGAVVLYFGFSKVSKVNA